MKNLLLLLVLFFNNYSLADRELCRFEFSIPWDDCLVYHTFSSQAITQKRQKEWPFFGEDGTYGTNSANYVQPHGGCFYHDATWHVRFGKKSGDKVTAFLFPNATYTFMLDCKNRPRTFFNYSLNQQACPPRRINVQIPAVVSDFVDPFEEFQQPSKQSKSVVVPHK